MGTVDLKVVVERGSSSQEDRNRRMEKLKTISTPETETDITSEISPATPKLEQVTPIGNDIEDDEPRNVMDLTLYNAARQGDADVFISGLERVVSKKRLALSAVFNQVSPVGNTYLHVAASFDNKEIVSLIAHHFPTLIIKKNFNGDTALHLAARAGHWNATEILLNFWKDFVDLPSVEEEDEPQTQHQEQDLLRLANEKGNTAIHDALMNSQYEIAYRLIEEDPEGAFHLNEKLESPLSLSAKVGSEKCVSLILSFQEELGKMIEQVKAGKSPVHETISSRNRDLLDVVFVKLPRSLHFTDEKGRFPLHYAASMGYLKEVGDLLDKFSANAFQRDKNGLLPVHWAAAKGKSRVIKKLLLHCPIPGELLDQNGYSILHFVAENGQYKAITKLLKDPAFEGLLNMKDKQGNTPLHLAAMHFHPKAAIQLIWDSRVNKTLLNDEGLTALDAASEIIGDEMTPRQELTWTSLKAAKVPQTHPEKSPIINRQMGNTEIKVQTKKHMNRINTLLLVATLVTTVTFAAGFTVPGGYNNSDPDQGIATLLQKRKFHLFIICDTIAVYSSMAAVLYLIRAQLGDPYALHWAFRLLAIALGMMALAFTAGVSVVVSKLKWLDNTIFAIGMVFLYTILVHSIPLTFPTILSRYFLCIYYCPFIVPMYLAKAENKVEMQE